MIESMGTYMHGVHQMGAAATDVMICLSVALAGLCIIGGYCGFVLYKVWRMWK